MRPDLHFDDPADAPGNKVLLTVAAAHASQRRRDRLVAPPLLYFTGREAEGRHAGHVRLDALARIERAGPVTQAGPRGGSFRNYRFTMRLVPLEEGWLPWDCINARSGANMSSEDAARFARRLGGDGSTREPDRRAPASGTMM
jgi:hypothetical protein